MWARLPTRRGAGLAAAAGAVTEAAMRVKVVWMKGHRSSWQYMHVLAAYPDAEAAEAEVICIRHAQALLGDGISNKCCDARGLAVRAHGYSFLYVCI